MSTRRKTVEARSRSESAPSSGNPSRSSFPVGKLVAAGILILFCTLGWFCWRRATTPKIPEISITGIDAAASGLITRHLERLKAEPRSAEAWGKLGGILRSYDYRDQAKRCLEQAEKLDAAEPRWPYLSGLLLTEQSAAIAITKFRRAVALCGNEPEMPRLRLARLLVETGRPEEARTELRELLRAKPDCAPARLALAQISLGRGEWDEALAMAKSSTTNPYTARAAWTLIAALHQRRSDTNAAQMASRRAAASAADLNWPDPFEHEILALRGDARYLSDRAQDYLTARRLADALPLVMRLAKEHPQFAETWLLLGRTRYLQQQPVVAEQCLRHFLELDPNSVNGHFQLGMSLLAQQRYTEAAATFEHATSLKRDFGPAFFNLGFALAKSGKRREAIAPFREAIRQNPEMIDSYILLADLHVQLGEKAEAIELAKLAERLDPSDPRLPALRGKIEQK